MPYQSQWVHEPYIRVTGYVGRVTIEDLKATTLEYLRILQQQKLYCVLDFTESEGGVPSQVLNMPSLLQIINHANTMWLAIISPTGESTYTAQLLIREKVKIFADRATALAFVRAMVRMDTGEVLEAKA